MIRRRTAAGRRAGIATVEAALVLSLVVVPLMLGVWEIGRLVYAQQVVATAAREGCRLAAQGRTINKLGSPTEIQAGSQGSAMPNDPNVWDTVYQSLVTGGLPGLARADVTCSFEFIPTPGVTPSGGTHPYQGNKNEMFTVKVRVPFSKVRWVNLGFVNPPTVEYEATWKMLVDDPFTIDPNLPNW